MYHIYYYYFQLKNHIGLDLKFSVIFFLESFFFYLKKFLLTIKKLDDTKLALQNVVTFSKENINKSETYFRFNNSVVYKGVASNLINKDEIGIGNQIRTKNRLAIGDKIIVEEYKITNDFLQELSLNIRLLDTKNYIMIHEDDLTEFIKLYFSDHYFHKLQVLVMKYKDETNFFIEILRIIGSKMHPMIIGGNDYYREEGKINNSTKIKITSSDPYFNIMSGAVLKRELFQDNYKFETIGIGGMNKELINIFRRALSSRAVNQKTIDNLGIKHVKGVLLFGPPGTGKTLIARKLGGLLTQKPPKIINGPEILNKFVGESEKNIRDIFSDAIKSPHELHIIIFDEIDAICRSRGASGSQSSITDSLVNQLLSMIDGVNSLDNIFIIAMTNRKDLLDPALLRPGRIEVHIEIGLPDINGREQILRIHTNKMRATNSINQNVDIKILAQNTENFSGAELEALVKNASSFALHEILSDPTKNLDKEVVLVTMNHFTKALSEITPAFGNNSKQIQKLIPKEITTIHETEFTNLRRIIQNKQRMKTCIISGPNQSGKTVIVSRAAIASNIKYTRMIRAIDVAHMDDYCKSEYILSIFTDAKISNDSLIIIDDVEIIINYANLDNLIQFSNKLYQTLLTVLKSPPDNPDNYLTILITCSDIRLSNILASFCTSKIEITGLI